MIITPTRRGTSEAIDWIRQLSAANLRWIEEPASPDGVLGHRGDLAPQEVPARIQAAAESVLA